MKTEIGSSSVVMCQNCDMPGVLRHAPPPIPASGIWCNPCYAKMERRSHYLNILFRYRALWLFALVLLIVLTNKVWAAQFTKATDCVVGTRVVNRDNQAGVIASVDGSSCRVKLDATGKIDYNLFWMLRPEGQGAASTKPGTTAKTQTPPPATGGISVGLYKCYMLVGTQLNYAFIDIRIDGADVYRDKNGKSGKYRIDNSGKITFTGPLSSANGKVLPGERIGLNMDGGSFYNTSCSRSK